MINHAKIVPTEPELWHENTHYEKQSVPSGFYNLTNSMK